MRSLHIWFTAMVTIGYMILALTIISFYAFFKLLQLQFIARKILTGTILLWANMIKLVSGVKFEILGRENIPLHSNFCVISNHQGVYDSILILLGIRRVMGFIAKKELLKIPLLSFWMWLAGCVFIDRQNRDEAMKQIKRRIEKIKLGKPMFIFPEGRRSRSQQLNPFKSGGLSAVFESGVVILPITVSNSYQLFEGNKKRINIGAKATLIIHKPIDCSVVNCNAEQLIPYLENMINPENYE